MIIIILKVWWRQILPDRLLDRLETYLGVGQSIKQIILKLLDAVSAILDLLHEHNSLLFELMLFLNINE